MKTYVSLKPLVPWRQLAGPLEWPSLFGRAGPLELEIGSGNGDRLLARAQAEPGLNLVGIDNSWPAIRRCLRKLGTHGARGVRLLQARGDVALARLFEPGSVRRMEALFPRPWPRPEQETLRLANRRFFSLVNSRLEPGGVFRLVTDEEPYLQWALGQVDHSGFEVRVNQRGAGLNTKYERKWLEQGIRRFHELILEKTGELRAPAWLEVELQYHRLKKFDPDQFPLGPQSEEPLVVFKDLIFDPKRNKAILRAMVEEEAFRQSFYLEFLIRDGGWFLRLAPGCGVVPIRAVQRALDLARDLAEAA